ncbi:MAG: UDP-3-O-(3-hydroxymyristoyl)glucosamine N-acyltransferase [Planctomycetota bacterium]|jgi:UDP-3-O-[3-hydroxymyristoyl] glucosamine N-acyltransferase|nr:UDP-3-O-(3-hydroxymyristoyl)glucosamine N-acyltransferase [Planctomycetota bacterium]
MPEIPLGLLAQQLEAVILKGDPGAKVGRLAGLEEAGPGDLSFLANPAYRKLLAASRAEAVIVGPDLAGAETAAALLQAANPDLAFARAALILAPPPPPPGVHPAATVSPGAVLGREVSVGAGAVVEDGAVLGDRTVLFPQTYVGAGARLGSDCLLYPGVRICRGVTVGSRCIFQAGAVIGSDGFGYAWTGEGYFKIPQVGTVVIEDEVEIGANSCVDRARFGETRIGRGTKLDNLVQIAHNVRLGPHCAFAAQVGIAGSARVGAGVQMGGQSAAVGHIRLGDGLTIVGQAAISKSIPGREAGVGREGLVWIDSPAKPMREHLEEARNLKALGRLRRTVKELEARLARLEGGRAGPVADGDNPRGS